ncbi:FecR family protein [Pedobacter ginsengisoli]|uniref:FecR family protein n=1 Tax=Pedobacter ginsengisoli TaxID=363852 RepID=UPI00254DEE2B|nr:FecR family protein [Pedobacter ginsengisoli]
MTKEEYTLLYEKYTAGHCTEQEKELFEAYTDEFALADEPWDTTTLGDEKSIIGRIYNRLQGEIQGKPRTDRFLWYKFSAAAAVLLILGSGLFYYYMNSAGMPVLKDQIAKTNVIKPGSHKAILTLQDGSTIVLDDSRNGIVASQGKTVILKSEDGRIVYNSMAAQPVTEAEEVYNTISTPRGGETQLLLPDGTKVWMNAESTIKFPAVFCSKSRKIELSGEAYLEVAENKNSPFKVLVKGTEVEVLGTHFNINAYGEGRDVNTTLLQGSVRLRNSSRAAMLKPGQSGVSSANGQLTVKYVNVEDAIAWKNGYFVYQDEDIYSIMEKAARWYDVEIEYRGNMKNKGFYGRGQRYENISELLKNLQLTGEVHFKVEGRRVIVMSK